MMKGLVLGKVILSSKVNNNRFAGMTIAWGFFGNMWNDIYFIAAVRPSRHTFLAIRKSMFFTVNFLDQSYKKELRYFGTVSGYSEDKFAADALHIDSRLLDSFIAPIEEARTLINCEVVTANQINPFTSRMLPEIEKYYPEHNDHHTMIYGKITSILKHE
ncbi:MAG: flavin reductase [Caldisericia bacterium]|nr:flavin reductase [Caldisericia bacterium]